MSRVIRLSLILVFVGGVLFLIQRNQLNAARADLLALKSAPKVETPAGGEDLEGRREQLKREIARLTEANQEIHKLRGQIRVARQQRLTAETLRKDNKDLEARLADAKRNNGKPRVQNPFANRGQATPEAAVETMLWAMREGRTNELSQVNLQIAGHLPNMRPQDLSNTILLMRGTTANVRGIQFLPRQKNPDGDTVLQARIIRPEGSSETLLPMGPFGASDTMNFTLQHTNGHWVIVGQF
ncbi:MAG TPA: hypothetical protein VEH27_16750 [Methylomirabilota bacterium]|nr:hypothetical protein [Methylomirabilota bacterium]